MMGYPRMRRVIMAVILAFAVIVTAPSLLPVQQARPSATGTIATARPQPPGNEPERGQPTPTLNDAAADVERERRFNAAADVERDQRFNELRHELLEGRTKLVDWWLTAIAIFLTVLGVIAVFAGYVSFRRFREIETEARQNVDKSKQHAEESKQRSEEAKSLVEEIRAELDKAKLQRRRLDQLVAGASSAGAPRKAAEAAGSVQTLPADSPINRDVTDARALEREGKIQEAIEKWRSIASMAEGTDNDLAARAWLSVADLLRAGGREDAGDQ